MKNQVLMNLVKVLSGGSERVEWDVERVDS